MERRTFFRRALQLAAMLPAAVTAYPRPEKKPPLTLLTTQLAGFRYYSGEHIWAFLKTNANLRLQRQADNPHDYRAVEVYWRNHKLGYIPRSDNAVIAQLLDAGATLRPKITKLENEDGPWRRVRFTIFAKL